MKDKSLLVRSLKELSVTGYLSTDWIKKNILDIDVKSERIEKIKRLYEN